MRRYLTLLLIIITTMGFAFNDAYAKRFGGGKSFGTYRSASTLQRNKTAPINSAANAQPRQNRWLAPLIGLAAGGLLASMFMGNGLSSAILSWLLVGGALLLILSIIKSFSRNRTASINTHNHPRQDQIYNAYQTHTQSAFTSNPTPQFNLDSFEFLREAKVLFYRLQAAYDQKLLSDIKQFTTPEVYAEVKLQLEEVNTHHETEVVKLEAELLDTFEENGNQVASVEFTGVIREDTNQPEDFREIWHFVKFNDQWLVSGVQQAL